MAGLGVPIPSSMKASDFMAAGATTSVTAGQYTQVGSYLVQKGERIAFGSGLFSSQDQAVGRLYALFQNATPAEVHGMLRIQVEDMNDNLIYTVGEFYTKEIDQGSADRRLRYPFSMQQVAAKYGRKIKLYFKPDADAVLTNDNCTLEISVTKKYVSND